MTNSLLAVLQDRVDVADLRGGSRVCYTARQPLFQHTSLQPQPITIIIIIITANKCCAFCLNILYNWIWPDWPRQHCIENEFLTITSLNSYSLQQPLSSTLNICFTWPARWQRYGCTFMVSGSTYSYSRLSTSTLHFEALFTLTMCVNRVFNVLF
jgi:hypothetical protein